MGLGREWNGMEGGLSPNPPDSRHSFSARSAILSGAGATVTGRNQEGILDAATDDRRRRHGYAALRLPPPPTLTSTGGRVVSAHVNAAAAYSYVKISRKKNRWSDPVTEKKV